MTVEYLDLADYLAIAAEITGFDATTLTKVTRLSLADSAQFRAVASVRHVRALVASWSRYTASPFSSGRHVDPGVERPPSANFPSSLLAIGV